MHPCLAELLESDAWPEFTFELCAYSWKGGWGVLDVEVIEKSIITVHETTQHSFEGIAHSWFKNALSLKLAKAILPDELCTSEVPSFLPYVYLQNLPKQDYHDTLLPL
eukprot:3119925-Amphidinium_carterae.1